MAPLFWHWNTVIFDYSPFTAIFICLFLAVAYVASLYIKASGIYERDHPETIKERFIRVTIVCIFVVPFLWLCSTNSHNVKARPLLIWIGVRLSGAIAATVIPLILTMILFLGPLALYYLDGVLGIYKDPNYWLASIKNLIWLRNHIMAPVIEEFVFRASMIPFLVPHLGEANCILIVPFYFSAPFSEEFIFRACMLPVLIPALGPVKSIFFCPVFFGVAHFHHMYEKIKAGIPVKAAALQSLFQFSYTTLFGAYSAFLFLRTGHLVAPVVAHAFCNHMGFPNFREVLAHKQPTQFYVSCCFVAGLLLWMLLLYPLTAPWIYANDLYEV